MLTTTPLKAVTSIEQIIGGCNQGVTIGSVNITSVDFSTRINKTTREGSIKKSLGSIVEVVADVSLHYDAGYQVHFTASYDSCLYRDEKGGGVTIDGINTFLKEREAQFYFGFSNPNAASPAWENLTLTVQNQAVVDYIKDLMMIEGISDAEEKYDAGTGVNAEITLFDHRAEEFIYELEEQLAEQSDFHKQHCRKFYRVPAELRGDLAAEIRVKVAELIGSEQFTRD